MSSTLSRGAFPLTVPALVAGTVAAGAMALISGSWFSAYAILVVAIAVGLTWRVGQPPLIPFIVVYQWTAITIGYWYSGWFGYFPSEYEPGDVDRTMGLALTGLLCLAAGIRCAYQLLTRRLDDSEARSDDMEPSVERLHALFLLVMGIYALDYLFGVNTKEWGGFDSLLGRLLDLRQVFLATLWFEVIRQRRHYAYIPVTLLWAVIPGLGSYYSDFRVPAVIFLVVIATSWRPWDREWWPQGLSAGAKSAPVVLVLLLLLLVWQAVKGDTRRAYDQGFVSSDPRERIALFMSSARTAIPDLVASPREFVDRLIGRISYITFFSRVLDHVPALVPHADGELLQMAIVNTTMPRVLFPDKPVLPSDSYYTRRFAGVQVDDTATSVSIGYMAEFYVDWGVRGMLFSIFLYGAWIGAALAVARIASPSPVFQRAIAIVICIPVMDFEHQFIKGFAGLNTNAVVIVGALWILRPWLVPLLGIRVPVDHADDLPDADAPAHTA